MGVETPGVARRPFLALIALTAALTGGAAPAAARSTTPDEGLWTTDGTVHALAREGRTVYVGGEFSWVGPHRGALARTDPAGGERRAAPRFTGGAVAAIEGDGAGGAFVGGSFTHVDGVERRHLVHLRPDGSLDPDWSPAPDGRVQALLRDGPTLYVGGTFDTPRRPAAPEPRGGGGRHGRADGVRPGGHAQRPRHRRRAGHGRLDALRRGQLPRHRQGRSATGSPRSTRPRTPSTPRSGTRAMTAPSARCTPAGAPSTWAARSRGWAAPRARASRPSTPRRAT